MKEDTTLVKQAYQYERGYYPSKTSISERGYENKRIKKYPSKTSISL